MHKIYQSVDFDIVASLSVMPSAQFHVRIGNAHTAVNTPRTLSLNQIQR